MLEQKDHLIGDLEERVGKLTDKVDKLQLAMHDQDEELSTTRMKVEFYEFEEDAEKKKAHGH